MPIKLSPKKMPKIKVRIRYGTYYSDMCNSFLVRKINNIDKYKQYELKVNVY